MLSDPDAMGRDLKPCPFCGGEVDIYQIGNETTTSRGFEVCCKTWGCKTKKRAMVIRQPLEKAREFAIAAWNRRAPMGGVSLDREGIARIIDSEAFRYADEASDGWKAYVQRHPNSQAAVALAKADAILSALPGAGQGEVGWRPIESAPKDGTVILAWCVHPHARWATDDKEWSCPVVTQWITHNGGGWTWNGMAGTFTHWMPLPPPPLDRAGGGAVEGEG